VLPQCPRKHLQNGRNMDFFKHTSNWIKGEIFEGGLILIYGISMLIIAFSFWKFSQFESTKALALPILIVGLFWGTAGVIGITYNQGRIEKVRIEYNENPESFIQSEKERVNRFWVIYRYAIMAWATMIVVGLVLFLFWSGINTRAIGIALILFGTAGLLVDHTSQNNAKNYYSEIQKVLTIENN
jgi:hypothetical protein